MNKHTPLGWRVQGCTGVILALMAAAAVRVDYLNNTAYGHTISPEMEVILGLAAIGVALVPAAASVLGWSWHKGVTTALCVALTVWSADHAYSTKQGQIAADAKAASDHYEAAKTDAELARQTLKRFSELGDTGQLSLIADQADAKVKADCRKTWTDACKEAQNAAKAARTDLSNAKTRDAAKTTLAAAKVEQKDGPRENREESPILTWLCIAVTQLVALLGEYALSLMLGAWAVRPKPVAKPNRKAKPETDPNGGIRQPLGNNVVSINARRNSVKAFVDNGTVLGGEMRGGDILKAYKRYAGGDMNASDLRAILVDLLGAGAVSGRTSGYTVKGRQLKASNRRTAKHAIG